MPRPRPADRRFYQKRFFVIGQSELNPDAFSGNEGNECTQSHATLADIYAVAANLLRAVPQDEDGNGDRTAEVASPFSQDQSVSRFERVADRLG